MKPPCAPTIFIVTRMSVYSRTSIGGIVASLGAQTAASGRGEIWALRTYCLYPPCLSTEMEMMCSPAAALSTFDRRKSVRYWRTGRRRQPDPARAPGAGLARRMRKVRPCAWDSRRQTHPG